MRRGSPAAPKYQKLFQSLKNDIVAGRYQPGAKLPSEAMLVRKTGASRITVGRALRELQNIGLIERVAGSGSYVRDASTRRSAHLFGLLIPDLGETEIFEPICRGIADAPEATNHALLWGSGDRELSKSAGAWRLCQQYIARKVSGVFFAPLEFEADADKVNRRIVSALREAGIPVILLDRRGAKSPERNRPDLVAINNHQAGYLATDHLIGLGCRRIAFMSYSGAAVTIEERQAGYEDALAAHRLRPALETAMPADPARQRTLSWATPKKLESVEAFVCLNDRVAGQLMRVFLARGIRVPQDIRLVGIDDVSYASLLPVPLTTVRQPTREIGAAALRTMLDRIATPRLPPREILLDGELIVRQSCGASPHSDPKP